MTRLIALESIRERGLRQGIMIQSHPSHISPHHHPSLTEWLGSNLEPSSELFVQEVIHQTQGWLVVTWGYLNRSIPTNYWYQRPTFQVIDWFTFVAADTWSIFVYVLTVDTFFTDSFFVAVKEIKLYITQWAWHNKENFILIPEASRFQKFNFKILEVSFFDPPAKSHS